MLLRLNRFTRNRLPADGQFRTQFVKFGLGGVAMRTPIRIVHVEFIGCGGDIRGI